MAHHLEKIFSGELLPNRTDPHTSTQSSSSPDDTTSPPFDVNTCPIDLDSINEAIKQLPRRKAPGVDHFTIEMLSPLLLYIFRLCWQWALTSTFRKILEKCIAPDLELERLPLDIAQGGFRRSRSTLDQALCLVETYSILRQHHRITPTLAFLDIKSAYDTVDRDHIWQTLQPSVSPPLLALLRNLFDEINIEVLLSNATSYRFSPATGVLQGSILSPFLYSIYINQLPALLRTQPIEEVPSTDTRHFAQSINCLLYADDVVLIAAPQDLAMLLQQCEDHSHRLGYRWNPLKCAILAPSSDTQAYSLYGTTIPRQGIFSYLGIPINPGSYVNTAQLIQDNVNKALQTMNQMTTIGVNNKGFDRLLSVRFYTQIVRSQLEYGLAISSVPAHQPTMKERVQKLQAKFLLRSIDAPDDTLLSRYLPYLRTSASHSQWYKPSKTTVWQRCTASYDPDELNSSAFKAIYKTYLEDNLDTRRSTSNSVLFSVCRPNLGLDPILWLPMTYAERSRVIRWRLGWLPGGIPQPCIYHSNVMLTRSHATECLHTHLRLQMPHTVADPLSFLLNQLPNKRKKLMSPNANSTNPAWTVRWPAICQILFELDYMHHGKIPPESPPLGTKLVAWICNN
ncbi:hypothetical protein RO3G_06780 [Rhizopus delemar RA 99-880]|uniref:Reverse transcriptase domain-containing protein n=3 Tax=Rhizopus TaxID=4842 RepID=I1C0U5_RHIO9|nr:hypothetical protein RO3G_06780 [Rhizopus delemar RA 99-880]|eukprot:EIE82075.1 hypothetical protein RO3G_06780 [Rhizopus delemar RA 99-880]